jgi:hypothetical protein
MTATAAPVRPAPRAARAVPVTAARLLRIELRHNAMPWILPLIAALFWFDSYRPSTTQSAFWVLRTFWNMGQGHTIIDFGPFVAGVAAWMGSRDGRRGMGDLVAGTPRSRWAAQLATWAATAIWAVAAYLAFVGVLFAVYARQGLIGTPPWWWVAVGATAVTAFSAAGFAVGVFFPSRFAAALAAFGGFLAMALSSQTGFSHTSGWALILPTNSNGNFQPDSGILYPYLPDLQIARIIFFAGLAVAAVAVLGLPARAGGPGLRRAAAVVALAGVAAAATAVWLADTARLGPHGITIPALHDAASDRLTPYTPVCRPDAGVPVCLSPAYRQYLPHVAAALRPVLAEVAGLPGAPSRVTQLAATYSAGEVALQQGMTISGRPPVLGVPLGALNLPGAFGSTAAELTGQLQLLAVHALTGAGSGAGTPAQQALQAVLLDGAGTPFAGQPGALTNYGLPSWAQADLQALTSGHENRRGPGPVGGPVYTAARRFAALPAATRHAWLAARLPALRAGHLTLAQLP